MLAELPFFDHRTVGRSRATRAPDPQPHRARSPVSAADPRGAVGLSRPVWVDDATFDVAYHVRRSALPNPGTRDQLDELVARLMARPLDRSRPLWEMYLIEGLENGDFAVVTKSHQVLVDGTGAIDIAQVMLDSHAEIPETPRVCGTPDLSLRIRS